jgi:hypothetical protein
MALLLSANEAAVVRDKTVFVLLSYGLLRAGLEPADLPDFAGALPITVPLRPAAG